MNGWRTLKKYAESATYFTTNRNERDRAEAMLLRGRENICLSRMCVGCMDPIRVGLQISKKMCAPVNDSIKKERQKGVTIPHSTRKAGRPEADYEHLF